MLQKNVHFKISAVFLLLYFTRIQRNSSHGFHKNISSSTIVFHHW